MARPALDTALTVVYLTALAYGAAFSYEVGYLLQFGLPWDMAEVDIRALPIAGVLLWIIAGAALILSDAVSGSWAQKMPPVIRQRALILAVLLVIQLLMGWLSSATLMTWVVLLWFPALGMVSEFVLPLWLGPKSKTRLARIEAAIAGTAEMQGRTFRAVTRNVDARYTNAWWIALTLLFLASLMGRLTARLTTVYLVANTTPACVVIRVSNTRLLCASYSEIAHTVGPEYRFLSLIGVALSQRDVGSLTAVKPVNLEALPIPAPVNDPTAGGPG